jgi:DNA polymerase I-like protein with 3'-5' exonuclease and polymerase domains
MAYGYVRDWAGRIRYLPGIHSPFKHIRAEAGRQSHSHKIQAGAQEIMKRGMATIDREVIPYWASQGKPVVPVLQVHDELMVKVKVADFPPGGDALEELNGQMRAAMFAAAPDDYRVPLDAGMAEGATWGDIDK